MADVPLQPAADPNRTAWPEVVGWQDFAAGLKIGYDRPDVTIYFFNLGQTRPPGFDPERVVVFVKDNIVAMTPVLG